VSGRIVGEVLKHAPEDLTTAQLLVLVALGEDAREKDRLARYSSLANLHTKTRLAPGSIKNILKQLTDRGLIRPLHRAQIGTVQHYRVTELQEHHRRTTASGATE
jgi:DNA-binding MarR family transcriptional regulator